MESTLQVSTRSGSSWALASLVVQNAGLILLTKHSFRVGAARYNRAAVILFSEMLKLLCSLLLEGATRRWSLNSLRSSLKPTSSNFALVIPSTLYVIQNVLQLSAIRGLSPAVYVTGAQLKVLSSAFFSTILLGRRLSTRQVVSFFPLMAGVALVQWTPEETQGAVKRVSLKAFSCLIGAVTISGLAGVLLEFAFQKEAESLWVKNFFLSLFSIPAALYAAVAETLEGSVSSFFRLATFRGFDLVVLSIINLLALGGLLSALVTKTSGTLTKCFATAISIVICTYVGVRSEGQDFSPEVSLGTLLVIGSVGLYAF